MKKTRYQRLSGLDQSFLHFETPSTYMHVALTAVFECGSLARPGDGIDIKRIRRYVASRLHLLPRYRQRLAYIPLVQDPVWIDDDAFDLDYHVRHTHVPRPGTERQLQTLCARILERPLDRTKPLWETWFIEGLAGGRFAMLSKVHHCMVDGIAGVDLLAALLTMAPLDHVEKPERWVPKPAPPGKQMLRDDLMRRARASLGVVRRLPSWMRKGGAEGAEWNGRLAALWGLVRAGVQGAADTPFNQPIGPHRRVDWLRFELDDVKAVKNRLGGTLNDVVLATVAGALRRFLQHRRARTDAELRAVVPVSVRATDERGVPGNRVSVWLAPLPIEDPDPRIRYARIRDTTTTYKENQQARGAQVLTETADWTTSPAIGLIVRLISKARAFNLIITNVPGPAMPFYLLDAPMVAAYPYVPLFENQGLGIALLSYAGHLYWGLVGDWDLMPDLHQLREFIPAAFVELREAAGLPAPATEPARPRPGRRSANGQVAQVA